MPQFYGTNEVRRQETRLRNAFALLENAQLDKELEAHFARYLTIRVAGFAEKALKDLVSAYARHHSTKQIHGYVEMKMSKLWGIDKAKLKEVINGLESSWWKDLEDNLARELDSLNSAGKTRNNVSHGGDQGITLDTAIQYRDDVIQLVRRLSQILDPLP